FYAIFAKCTHLGCTPRWLKTEQKFKCPCHGSGYYINGLNFEGPAPRPMDRFKISVGDDGQLIVDKSVLYEMQPGVDPNEQHPESTLKVGAESRAACAGARNRWPRVWFDSRK